MLFTTGIEDPRSAAYPFLSSPYHRLLFNAYKSSPLCLSGYPKWSRVPVHWTCWSNYCYETGSWGTTTPNVIRNNVINHRHPKWYTLLWSTAISTNLCQPSQSWYRFQAACIPKLSVWRFACIVWVYVCLDCLNGLFQLLEPLKTKAWNGLERSCLL